MSGRAGYRRSFLLALVAVLVVVLLGPLVLRLYGSHRIAEAREHFEESIGPLDPAAYELPRLPDHRNAAVQLTRGAAALELTPEERKQVFELALRPSLEWASEDTQELEAVLSRNGSAVELLLHARELPSSDYPSWAGTDSERSARLVPLIEAGRLLAAKGHLAVGRDLDEAIASVEALARLANSLQHEPENIYFMLGVFVEWLQLCVVHEIITRTDPDAIRLQRLRSALLADDLRKLWRTSYAIDAAVHARVWADELRDMKTPPVWTRYWYSSVADLMLADSLELTVDMADALSAPYVEVQGSIETVAARWSPWSGRMGSIIVPTLTNVSGRAAAVETLRRQAALAIALRQHALERGAYPDTLEGFPGADEPSPLTGRLLSYERTRGGGAILLSPESAERVERDQIFIGRGPRDAYRWELPAVGLIHRMNRSPIATPRAS